MKKFTILCAVLFAGVTAFAAGGEKKSNVRGDRHPVQKSTQFKKAGSSELSSKHEIVNSSSKMNRTSSAPFYSEVFAGGIPPTWQNIDSSGSGVRWTWTTTGTFVDYLGNDSLSVVGTSASNGYLMFDSDSAGGTAQGEYGVLITDAIDCSTHPTVRVTFNEYFTKYDALTPTYLNTARVYVSTDGTTWTMIHAADDGLAVNDETPNPQAVSLNISSIAGGQATVYFKFSFTGDYSYWWFVDDLELSEVGAIDAGVFGILDPYNGCLLSATEDIVIGVLNAGADTLMDFPVSYSINGGTPVDEIITDTLAPGDSLVYTFTTQADLSVAGSYDIVSYVTFPGDTETGNDTAAISTVSAAPNTIPYTMGFEAGEDFSGYSVVDVDGDGQVIDLSSTYTRSGTVCLRFPFPTVANSDNWVISNCFDLVSGVGYTLDFWFKVFDISPAVPYSLEAYVGNSTDIGTMSIVAAPPTPGDTMYTNVSQYFTVPTSGIYYFAFRAFGTNVDNTLRIDDITVDFAVGVNNPVLNDAVMVYPNPSQGKIFVANKGISENSATINVMNTVGQVVATVNSNNFVKETIDLSTQPDGLYTVQIRTNAGVITKTVMVSSK
ncbi:MAG TPA: choice-of-anchor J domain-containing protein [Bacteroidia bacterium]|nr:choice-of-anchor J domain-containing protein [Bacteroidia bacterium]